MRDECPSSMSVPAADWLSHSRHINSISSASPALLEPQSDFTYTVLAWLFAGGVILPMLALLWMPNAATDCQTEPLALKFGREMNVKMSVGSGMSCALFTRAGSVSLDDVVVEAAPENGTVNPRGRTGVTYRAKPAYKGDDAFTIALKGRSGSESGAMKVRVNVAVR